MLCLGEAVYEDNAVCGELAGIFYAFEQGLSVVVAYYDGYVQLVGYVTAQARFSSYSLSPSSISQE